MIDFTKKGTKLPVIPVGTEYTTTSAFGTISKTIGYKSGELESYGMHDNDYLKCDVPKYLGCNFLLFKLSTIERLAKEQGMCNTNNEIEMKTEFKIGDYVKVIRDGANASDFTLKIPSCKINGVYSKNNWENIKFQILGNYEPITFEHNPKIYGAYPLGIDGKIIGYVYNDAIQHYSDMNPTIKLQENGTVTVTDTETTTTLSKVTVDEICRLVKEYGENHLKIGKWYQSKFANKYLTFCNNLNSERSYGFNTKGEFTNEVFINASNPNTYIEATPETVEQYLRDEFIRLGGKVGAKVECLGLKGSIETITSMDFYFEQSENYFWVKTDTKLSNKGACIFDNGKFATIIQPETITRAEAEKRYDVKITD